MNRDVMRWLATTLVVVGVAAAAAPVARWDFENPAENAAWERSGLWKFVTQSDLANEPVAIRTFPSPTRAAYFGEIRAGRGSYDTGNREQGALSSPWLPVGASATIQPGDLLRVRFSYCRQVESYNGAYDKTVVLLYFRNGAGRFWNPTTQVWQMTQIGIEVFAKDSSHPSQSAWQPLQSAYVRVPADTVDLRIAFLFDSVDHVENAFLGWLVDNVEIDRTSAPLAITTESLPEGRVRWWYWHQLEGTGGTPPYSWRLAAGSKLPNGLALDRERGEITGTPTEAGTFDIEFVLTDSARGEARKRINLVVRQAAGVGWGLLGHDFGNGLGGWETSGLWHDADLPRLGRGAYYAVPGQNSYDTGARTQGCLRSPEIVVADHRGRDVALWFVQTREVEAYAGGAYDKTYVQIRFHDGTKWGEWTTAWTKDSRDPSTWPNLRWEEVFTQVPANGKKMQVQFCFDSVDRMNNGFAGWFVVRVGVVAFTGQLSITTAELPPGELGVPYSAALKATGGAPWTYQWSATGLPEGLVIERDTGRIFGVPRRAGTFTVRVTVEDWWGNPVSKELPLEIKSEQVTLFFDDFDEFADGASWLPLPGAPNLWRVENHVWHGGQNLAQGRGRVAYYGNPWGPNYDTGDRTTGALTSRPIELSGATHVVVGFDYWRQVESYNGEYDQTYVQVRFTGGDWKTLWYRDSRNPSENAWTTYTSPGITVPSGATTMQVRFVFDSVDRFNNGYVGWLLDNVRVRKTSSGSPLAALEVPAAAPRGAPKLTVFNYPNPVRDVYTTTFAVRGVEAEAIRVEIFDLAGRLVYRAEAAGSALVWHTDDLYGRYLANGVYLYRAYVKVGGTWIASEVQKLAILR